MKLKAPFAVLCSALLLQGCIAGVVIGSAAIATKTATDPRSIGTQVDDGTLEARVENALSKDPQLKKDARVVATAYQGEVLLTGQSPNSDMTRRAKKIAMGVEGASEVYNEIRQGKPVSLSTASSDTWITTKVRSQLLTSDTVKSTNVKVTTENGEVFLLGLVTRQEGQAAAQIASQISGVKHVTTAFSYVK
ncbi:division/outer membrane stress-associated lipid-binding lipoprotein [Serratia symbiotica]|uniref:Uncharacterized protein YraP n=1 Tax=Serratia symbiotica SCt-VLC TaxID=1347341 RepID=A0A068RCL7_9GAMM|nr:division/outer membrane stress-associated lipid-binding lipoprotein [Serratia symbiotica]CDG48505.1 Uncharacterized protein YraP [Serratia symbiotica SCt-VLC]